MNHFDYIETSEELADICSKLKNEKFIAVDTEFSRDKYYFPRLCLVQIKSKQNCYLIDTQKENLDLNPLWQILEDEKILKILHSCQQDVECVYKASGNKHTIKPIFDTQLAVMLLGYHHTASYANLALDFLGLKLNKAEQYSNWERRPLKPKQLKYAAIDVIYLYDIYKKIIAKLKKAKRLDYLNDDFLALSDASIYDIDLENLWQDLPLSQKDLTNKNIPILKHLTIWRENLAIKQDKPRQFILKDTALKQIALIAPKNKAALGALNKVTAHMHEDILKEMLNAVKQGKAEKTDDFPQQLKLHINLQTDKVKLDLLRIILDILCQKYKIAHSLVISTNDTKKLIHFLENNKKNKNLKLEDFLKNLDIPLTKSWRYDLFGEKIFNTLLGKYAIYYQNGDIKLAEIS